MPHPSIPWPGSHSTNAPFLNLVSSICPTSQLVSMLHRVISAGLAPSGYFFLQPRHEIPFRRQAVQVLVYPHPTHCRYCFSAALARPRPRQTADPAPPYFGIAVKRSASAAAGCPSEPVSTLVTEYICPYSVNNASNHCRKPCLARKSYPAYRPIAWGDMCPPPRTLPFRGAQRCTTTSVMYPDKARHFPYVSRGYVPRHGSNSRTAAPQTTRLNNPVCLPQQRTTATTTCSRLPQDWKYT
jgi:hypothetical protein